VRAPHKAPHVDPPAGEPGQHGLHFRAGLAAEAFVTVAAPVGKEHEIAVIETLEDFEQPTEVLGPMHQGRHPIALDPSRARHALPIDVGVGIPPLVGP
jgi:hypothetical protein